MLAAQLALGHSPLEAARTARALAGEAVANGLRDLGAGAGPVDVLGLAGSRSRSAGELSFAAAPVCHNRATMKLLRMKPGHGEIVLAEGDVEVPEQERELIEAFRRQLDAGMWAAVPTQSPGARREAELVKSFAEVPREAERVIFFPRAAGGALEHGPLAPMPLALGTAAILLVVLLWELARPTLKRASRARAPALGPAPARASAPAGYDPGRERRAELRARALLRSCIEERDWAMYRDLGFLRVWGTQGEREAAEHASYAYLIYPHKPIVAYVPQTGALLNEYCVAFPDLSRPYGSSRLPDSDDVLAKWMALTADERRLIADANMHLPGRQVDPGRVRRDLARLARWERERAVRRARACPAPIRVVRIAPIRCTRELRRSPQEPRPDRGPRARRRALLPARDRLHRRGSRQADRRRGALVDRDDALQLQQPGARGEGQGGHPRRRRHADGAEHDRDLRRDHDGHLGMRASLVSRELIADSIELVASAHAFDALVTISGCDKTIPGTVMALARLDIPGLMLYGGSIKPGHYKGAEVTIQQVFEAVGQFAAGKITEEELHELEEAASPGAGACGGQFTANTMAMAFEALGISPAGSAMVPAEDGRKLEVAKRVRRTGDGRPAPRAASERDDHQAGAGKRDRGGRDERRLDQRRAASARGRARNGRAAGDRRVRGDLRAHAAACATCSPAGSTWRRSCTRRAACRSC